MSKHTKRPWEIATDPTELRCKAIKARIEYEPREFASVWVAREVAEADACLISAAPDLLAACEKAIGSLDLANEDTTGKTYTLYVTLRDAIAKAKGS